MKSRLVLAVVAIVVLCLASSADAQSSVSGTSTRIGDFEFSNFSNGTRCTTTQIGNYSFTNC